ncbi:MAG: hypothetical protein R2695_08720 [Acidimicrobiales bacterium]
MLYVRPAVNYPNGHRIIVALRDLVDAEGNPIEPTDAFPRLSGPAAHQGARSGGAAPTWSGCRRSGRGRS